MERQDTADIGNNYVHAFGKMNLARVAAQEKNSVTESISGCELAAEVHHAIHINCIHAARTRLAGTQRKNSRSATEIDDSITRPDALCNRRRVSLHADFVRKHQRKFIEAIHCWRQ